ncbi:transposase [Gleimia hominis]|uniref:transposase n=1 Tax=Gleimia hominis TaxID=595468 RepID=UPI0026C3DB70
MPKAYSDQFKADAVALVESGMGRCQVCADLGVLRSWLQKWVMDARLVSHGINPSSDPETVKLMRAALKRIRELEMENEVLPAAAAYLSQEVIRPRLSTRPWKH